MGNEDSGAASPLVYLTGAPASGKTSVADHLVEHYGASRFSYGRELLKHPSLVGYTHSDLRSESAKVVLESAVRDLDRALPELVRGWRNANPVVIDSHAVTSERWGLKAVPYSVSAITELAPSHLICLACDPETLARRIFARPDGRRAESGWKMDLINHAQVALTFAYAHSLGIAAHVVDASAPLQDVVNTVADLCQLLPTES